MNNIFNFFYHHLHVGCKIQGLISTLIAFLLESCTSTLTFPIFTSYSRSIHDDTGPISTKICTMHPWGHLCELTLFTLPYPYHLMVDESYSPFLMATSVEEIMLFSRYIEQDDVNQAQIHCRLFQLQLRHFSHVVLLLFTKCV